MRDIPDSVANNDKWEFDVIDNQTGKPVDYDTLMMEDWVQDALDFNDLKGFAIYEGGCLILLDDCMKWIYAPKGRFVVQFKSSEGICKGAIVGE